MALPNTFLNKSALHICHNPNKVKVLVTTAAKQFHKTGTAAEKAPLNLAMTIPLQGSTTE